MADIPEDDRLWWFLFVLRACGKSGAESNGDPEEWVAAFCDDVEPTDTFNRACALGFALCTHNSLFDTSTVWITDKGKAWLVAHAHRLSCQDPETIRQAALEEIAERLDVRADEQDVLALREGLEDWEIFQNRHCERVLRREAEAIRALKEAGR